MSETVVRTFESHGRSYTEMNDGTIFCDRRECPGSIGLRGQRTGVPICMSCAVQTPVGYISKDAAREQANKFFNIESSDYVVAAIIAFMITFISGFMVGAFFVRFSFFGLFVLLLIGGAVGGTIGEVVVKSIKNRRGRYTSQVVGGAMVTATFFAFLFTGLSLMTLIYGLIVASATVSRFEIALRA